MATRDDSKAQFSAPVSWPANRAFFPGQADWANGVFDWVGVKLEAAVVEKAGAHVPVGEPIADVFGQPGAGRYHRQLHLEQRFEGVGALTILQMAALGHGVDLRSVAKAGPRVTAAVVPSLVRRQRS